MGKYNKGTRMMPREVVAARIKLGMSQVQLAKLLRVSDRTVGRWEQGAVPVPEATAMLLRILGESTEASGMREAMKYHGPRDIAVNE